MLSKIEVGGFSASSGVLRQVIRETSVTLLGFQREPGPRKTRHLAMLSNRRRSRFLLRARRAFDLGPVMPQMRVLT